MASNGTINVSVSSHYHEPSYDSEITSQGILGESVELLEQAPPFTRIRQGDGYESWISTDQVYPGEDLESNNLMVRSHFIRIHKEPSTLSDGVRDGVIGCTLKCIDEEEDWYKILLPDGISGWAEKRHFGNFPPFSAENVIRLAREFLGYQYSWGGCSPKGFDCSGFVQTVFRLLGLTIARDSWQQQQQNLFSTDYHDALPADLLFFGKTPERVTHVAISLGNRRFIHASGWVRYNSFRKADEDFSNRQLQSFISVNRYSL